MYLCEQCGKEVHVVYGSGRFCSLSCANKYVALNRSSRYNFTREDQLKGGRITSKIGTQKRKEWLENVIFNNGDAWRGSYTHFRDLLVEFGYKEWKCEVCGNTEWMGSPIPLEVHHLEGKSNNLSNIKLLCPNCHAQTPDYKWKVNNKRRRKECNE